MNDQKMRKQRIAKQLGVSVQVLEQYLQGKRAEMTGEATVKETVKEMPVKPRRLEREGRERVGR